MHYIDTHCHLDDILSRLEVADFATFKARFLPEGFEGCISIACDARAVDAVSALAREDGVYAAYGLHPHEAKDYGPELEARLRAAMSDSKTLAWGEIGLDYHYNLSPPERQREVFARQIRLGVECGKPLIVHTREAEADTLDILKAEAPRDWRIHVHCFTSSPSLAESLLEGFPNLCLGFTGIITFKNALELQGVARNTPLDRLLLETDGPYLAPVPHRGKVAHPGHIPLIARKLAELKGLEEAEIFAAARENTRRIYGI